LVVKRIIVRWEGLVNGFVIDFTEWLCIGMSIPL